jgi:transcriptional regulator with XRE-family HTH domain
MAFVRYIEHLPMRSLTDEDLLKELGLRIRALRDRDGVRQGDLATKAKIRRTHLSQIERGTGGAVKINTLYAISRALNVPLAELLRNVG